MWVTEIFIGVLIAIGLVGIILPVLPGSLLVLGAIGAWSFEVGETHAYVIFGICACLIVLGNGLKWIFPGRSLKDSGTTKLTLLLGGVLGIVGFFAIPVIGLPVGFVAGIYIGEYNRVGSERAWAATKNTLKAIGVGIAIEFAFSCMAALVWLAGVITL